MKFQKSENLFFLILILVIMLVGISTFFKDGETVSQTENRKLNTFEVFNFDAFMNGDFQNNLESAISDQFWQSEEIRTNYIQTVKHLPTFGIGESICSDRYLALESNTGRARGVFNCGDYIIYMPEELSDEKKEIISENLSKYNKVNLLSKTYYYFVDDPSVYDFEHGKKVMDYFALLKQLEGYEGIDRLDYNDYESYKKYFYKTDHHWDYRGSYQGAIDVLKLLGIKNELKHGELNTNHEDFFGSYAKATSNYDYREEFSYYDYELPPHDTMINDKAGKYNHYDEYKNHEYEYNKMMNHYAYVYGDDYAEVVFDYHQPKKDNLLIISNSYSNAINEVVAQYFDKTYVIDLRHYREEFGKDFVLSEYVKEKNIDKTLLLISPTFIWSRESNRGLEL